MCQDPSLNNIPSRLISPFGPLQEMWLISHPEAPYWPAHPSPGPGTWPPRLTAVSQETLLPATLGWLGHFLTAPRQHPDSEGRTQGYARSPPPASLWDQRWYNSCSRTPCGSRWEVVSSGDHILFLNFPHHPLLPAPLLLRALTQ